MRLMCQLTVLAFSLCLAVACGTDVESNNGQTDPDPENQNQGETTTVPELADANDQLVTAYCEKVFDCCSAGEMEEAVGTAYDDVEDCLEQNPGLFGGIGGSELDRSYEEGNISFDDGPADDCAASIEGLGCGEFQATDAERRSLPGCADMVTGTVGNGGNCAGDWECESEFCVFSDGEAESGTCDDPPSVGEACASRRCGSDAHCDRFDDECVDLRQNGEACSDDAMCDSGYCGKTEVEEGVYEQECMEATPACGG